VLIERTWRFIDAGDAAAIWKYTLLARAFCGELAPKTPATNQPRSCWNVTKLPQSLGTVF